MDKEIKTSTFSGALAYERSCQPLADSFLKSKYPDKRIYRPDYYKSGYDKELQLADVDVIVSNKEGWPNEWYISEKFRSKSWPDVLIELYSDYDKKVEGWAPKSIAHEHYFYYSDVHETKNGIRDDSFLRIVPTWAIKRAAKEFKLFLDPIIKDMYLSGVKHRICEIMGYQVIVILNNTYGSDMEVLYFSASAAIDIQYFKDIKANITEINTKDYAVDRKTDTRTGDCDESL